MKKLIINNYAGAMIPAISKGFKYFILFTFALISINSAQNNPIKKEAIPPTPTFNKNIDSIGRVVEANWDSIDHTRADIFNELSLLKQKIKNTKRPMILIADTVYVTDTVMMPRRKILDFLKRKN